MKSAYLLVCLFTVATGVFAQVSGVIKDEKGKSLTGVTVSLNRSKDSVMEKLNITDSAGSYAFCNVPAGNYFISLSSIGYTGKNSDHFIFNAGAKIAIPSLIMYASSSNLKTVVVTDRKPMIEVKSDRTIFNIENSINAAGQTAFELLRKSPGVVIDKDDNINLNGKNGVQVFIDGRPTPLTDKDLSDYLKSLQSADIEAIEIISNPSAKYEAAGNAGIINIRLKKSKSFGTNGSIVAGYNLSNYSKYNTGFTFNHRTKKINVFGNYNYNVNNSLIEFYIPRQQVDTLFDQLSRVPRHARINNFKTGLDYFINKRNTIGLIVNGTFFDYTAITKSNTTISYIPTGVADRILRANNDVTAKRRIANFNINYHYIDSAGRELTTDIDYGIFNLKTFQEQPNNYYDPSGKTLLYSDKYNISSPTNIRIYSFKTDYEQNLAKGKLGIGFKVSYVKTGNNFQQYNVQDNVEMMDTLNSSIFNYQENINAAYFNYNRPFKSWVVQAGLRVENTNIIGQFNGYKAGANNFVGYDSLFTRHYSDLFPSASITYNKTPSEQWIFSFSKRIDRPAYRDLNPFQYKLDEYTFVKGNTNLRPQYTNSIGLTFIYKNRLTTTFNYSHIKDFVAQFVDTIAISKAFLTKQNFSSQNITSLNISYPFEHKWYGLHVNFNAFYAAYNADLGGGRIYKQAIYAFTFFHQQTFNLGSNTSAELSGFYNSPSIQGTFKAQSFWSLDAGVQKLIFNKAATVKISVSDVFSTQKLVEVTTFAGETTHSTTITDSRQLKLFFTYRFGNKQLKAARQHASGAEEESSRVGTKGN